MPLASARPRVALLVVTTLAAAPALAHAQRAPAAADREGVRRAVLDYVEGFYEGDSTKLLRSVAPSVRKSG